jgi:hypothetical protein
MRVCVCVCVCGGAYVTSFVKLPLAAICWGTVRVRSSVDSEFASGWSPTCTAIASIVCGIINSMSHAVCGQCLSSKPHNARL